MKYLSLIFVLLLAITAAAQAPISSPSRVVYRASLPATCAPATSPMVRLTVAPFSLNNCTASNTYSVVNGNTAGAASSTDNAVVRFDGTGGKTLQNSVVIVGDTGNVTGVGTLGLNGSTSGTTTVQATAIAGTTTLTLPAVTDTLVALAATQTLTNKTLTAPVINSPTGIIKDDVGLSSVDNTSDANKPVSTAQQTALDLKANDNAVAKLTGDQTLAGVKTFTSDPLIPDEAYGAGWNASLEPPTKNAVYDKIETLGGGGITNGAGVDIIPRSDGTNLVAGSLSDNGSGTVAGGAGINLIIQSTPPAGEEGTQGADITVQASAGFATGSDDPQAGGGILIKSGNAAVGDGGGPANGGTVTIQGGTGATGGSQGIIVLDSNNVKLDDASYFSLISLATDSAGKIIPGTLGVYASSDSTLLTDTLTNTDLTVTVVSGRKYAFTANLYISNLEAADGFKVDFGGGTATSTYFIAGTSSALVTGVTTSLTDAFSASTLTGTHLVTIHGSFQPSSSGTFVVRAAADTFTAGGLVVMQGSSLVLTRLP